MTDGDTEAFDLSVVIPCHDVGATLAEQLDAILGQVWPGRFEVVLVENGSADDTLAVAERYATTDSRVRVIRLGGPGGASRARNAGAAAAKADRIAFCDGDDVVQPGWLAALGEALVDHPVVTGPLDTKILNPQWLVRTRGELPADAPRLLLATIPVAPSGNVGVRREVWERLGGFDEQFGVGEDQELSIRLWQQHVPVHFEAKAAVAYRYRTDAGSLFRQGRSYGHGRAAVYSHAAAAGVRAPHFASWRSWVLLVASLPRLTSSEGRASWCWLAGVRLGQIEGSVRERHLYL